MLGFDAKGREIPDPTPIEVAPGAIRPESLTSIMQRMIRQHLSQAAEEHGFESLEEANDFDVGEDEWDDQLTKYEVMGDEFGIAEVEDTEIRRDPEPGAPGEPLRSGEDESATGARGTSQGARRGQSGIRETAPSREDAGESDNPGELDSDGSSPARHSVRARSARG